MNSDIVLQALQLTKNERIQFIEILQDSLERPDNEIESAWQKEIHDRLEALDKGEFRQVSESDVFSRYSL